MRTETKLKPFNELTDDERYAYGKRVVEGNIYHCASALVAKMSEYEHDEWSHLFSTDDWNASAEYHINNDMDKEELLAYIEEKTDWDIEPYKEESIEHLRQDVMRACDDDQEFCEEYDLDPQIDEIYEHWIINDWLADRLAKKGNVVSKDFHGLTIWGRPTTGQNIALDYTIQLIGYELDVWCNNL